MVFSFVGFELDEDRFELRRDGAPIRVEPRVLDLLIYLVQHRVRIVSKDELIEKVWRQAVSESALTRCVTTARKVVESDPTDGEVIRTIHGRGYRFVAAVDESGGASAPNPPSSAAAGPTPIAVRARPRITRMRVAGASLATAILAGAAIWMQVSAAGALRGGAPVRIALLPVSIESGDRESQLLAFSVSDSLANSLSRVPGIALQPPEYGRALSLEAASLAEFAERSRTSYVISGGLRRSDGGLKAQLAMTLHEIRPSGQVRNTPLGRYDVPYLQTQADVGSFVAVRDAIARNLLEELLPALRGGTGAGTGPNDPEAYRLYLLGKSRLGEGACDGEAALELLRQSLEIDPRYAAAWEAYGWAEYGLASSCARDGSHYQKALSAADRALALSPGWPRAIGLKTVVLTETGRVEEAYALLHRALIQSPASSELRAQLFYVLAYSGFLEEARGHLDELLRYDPTYLTEYGWTPNPLLYQGDIDRFLRYLPGTNTPLFRYYRGLAEMSRGKREAARAAVEPAFRLNPGDIFARLSQALLAIVEDDPAAARAVLDQLAEQRRIVGSTDGEMTFKVGQLYVMAGDPAAGLAQIGLAVQQGFFCVPCLENDPILTPLRSSPRYREIVALARSRHDAFGARFGL